ncbi:Spo0E family sporulation regulatory protein-aspartic acid phosphatase [Niallia sp. 03133]|uniref:Spo0E family sporulation regulatory protein-aspartic acid phosphatase n=1 Tax=Niallia sp. 03133 TaxID=3458060 RepID=UPI00404433AF
MSNQQLLNLIEKKRDELVEIVVKHGFSSPLAITCSQELDLLLNQYNKYSIKKTGTFFRTKNHISSK